MNVELSENYKRVEKAIEFISLHFKEHPSLDEIAAKVNLSPFHFQRLFQDWAGVSPKKFLQFISIEYAKGILKQKEQNLFNVALETGLSGTSRLHDLFINIESMTPGEFQNGGKALTIQYNFYLTPFGEFLIASTIKGICFISFVESKSESIKELHNNFPNALFLNETNGIHERALSIFKNDWTNLKGVKLHLKGTEFQLKVWQALLKIPFADLYTYSQIAHHINSPKASRAVGTAIGSNPIAYLIPCHRVIQSTGLIGGYMWGSNRKKAIIAWEQSNKLHNQEL